MQRKTSNGRAAAAGFAALTGVMLMAGCQCTPPVREYVETRTEYDVSKSGCCPAKVSACPTASKLVTVVRREAEPCPALPPVGEITVMRSSACPRTKMVFVSVRPTDDRCFNVENRNFERPWPWGPYVTGDCQY